MNINSKKISEWVIVCDKKGCILSLGADVFEAFGIDAADIEGKDVSGLISLIDEGDTEMASELKGAIKAGEPFNKGYDFRRKDGSRRIFDVRLMSLMGTKAEGDKFMINIREISDFVRLEEILEQYAEGLTILYEISNDFLSKTGMVEVMTGALDMIKAHYEADEVQVMVPYDSDGGSWLELTAASTGSSVKHGARVPLSDKLLAGRSMKDLCPVVVADFNSYDGVDGAEFVAEGAMLSGIAVPMVVEGKSFGVLSILYSGSRYLDTAELWYLNVLANSLAVYIEKERSLSGLSNSERFLNSILEGIGEGVIVIDKDFKIMSANRGYLDFVGKSLEEVVGSSCHETSHGREMPCAEYDEDCTVKKVYETGMPHSSMHTHIDKNGANKHIKISSYPIFGADGKEVIAVVETLMNMTDSIQLEKDLEKRVQELEDFYDMAVGRELRMMELKEQIEELREDLSKCRER